jgi:hypothetical protein
MATVRHVTCTVTFAGEVLTDVLSARGQVVADAGWPTCSVFVTHKPETGNEEDGIQVVAGAGTDVIRFQGRVRRFQPSAFPKAIEIVAKGELAYANEWSPAEDIEFEEFFPGGAADADLVMWALSKVPGVTFVPGDIAGSGKTLGLEVPEQFDWPAGRTAWSYIRALDRASLYRTYQDHVGAIRRVKMIGYPNSTPDFTLGPADMLDGASGTRDTEQTKNYVVVEGWDYQGDTGPALGIAFGANDFQGPGDDPATRHAEMFQSNLIEDGNDEDGVALGFNGLNAQELADEIILDVNKEFVEAQIPSWRDDLHGPGMTVLLEGTQSRLAVEGPMWVAAYAWEVGDNGWTCDYQLTGGGLPVGYEAPRV